MGGEVLNHSDLVEHNDLGDKRESLEPQRVAPSELPRCPASLHNARQHESSGQQDHEVWERVAEGVIGHLKGLTNTHQVDDEDRA